MSSTLNQIYILYRNSKYTFFNTFLHSVSFFGSTSSFESPFNVLSDDFNQKILEMSSFESSFNVLSYNLNQRRLENCFQVL